MKIERVWTKVVEWLDTHNALVAALAALVAALATVVIAYLTIFLAKDSRQQATTIQNQLTEMQDEQRPWISATPTLTSPITYDGNGAHMRLVLTMKNTGHLPAIDIRVEAQSDTARFQRKYDTKTALLGLCEKTRNAIEPFVLFPGDTFPLTQTFDIPPTELSEARMQSGVAIPGFLPVINICITYLSPNGTTSGQTAISYQLGFLHGQGFSYVPVDRSIQPDELIIIPNVAGGSFLK
jgi:hypothetical protein